jgi:hypothetical protein
LNSAGRVRRACRGKFIFGYIGPSSGSWGFPLKNTRTNHCGRDYRVRLTGACALWRDGL